MKTKFIALAVVLAVGLFAYKLPPVYAEDGTGSGTSRPFFGTPSASPRVRGLDRLEDKRLKFCQNHEAEIGKRMSSLIKLVTNMLTKFDAIATRVEDYYNNKVVPSGKTVPNYTALVADIATKKAAVQTALTNAENDISSFKCTDDNPKGELKLFRTGMQAVKSALHDYRTSIKNLIVAVKSVVGETEGKNESPKPSATPTGP